MLLTKMKKMPVGAKAAIVYTLASVLSRGLSMITLPIFTRIMTTSEIGVVNMYNSWYGLLFVVVSLSLTSGGFQAAMKDFPDEKAQYQSSVLTITMLMSLVAGILYFINPAFWNDMLGLPTELCILMIVSFFLLPAQDFWLLRQRYEYKYKFVGALTIGSVCLSTFLSIITVLYLNDNGCDKIASGRLISMKLVPMLISLILAIYIFIKGRTFYSKIFWKYSLAISLPLIGYSIAAQILNASDRIMISKMVGESEVGIYGTLFTVSSVFTLVWTAINSTFIPYLYQNIDNPENRIDGVSIRLLGAYSLVAVVMTFLAPEIVRVLATKEYYEAIYIMPPIAAGVFLNAVSNMYSNILIYHKRTKCIMHSATAAAGINVVLNYIFINKFGYMAAAYTTLVAHIVLVLPQIYLAKKVHSESESKDCKLYNDKNVLLLGGATIILCLTGLLLYKFLVLRYTIIIIGLLFGGKLGYKTLKSIK